MRDDIWKVRPEDHPLRCFIGLKLIDNTIISCSSGGLQLKHMARRVNQLYPRQQMTHRGYAWLQKIPSTLWGFLITLAGTPLLSYIIPLIVFRESEFKKKEKNLSDNNEYEQITFSARPFTDQI